MKLSKFVVLFMLCILSTNAAASAEWELEQLLTRNLLATQDEDIESVLSNFHTQSPIYLQTKEIHEHIFESFDLQVELLSFTFMGQDQEFAYGRIKYRTEKIRGPAFSDYELEAIVVFAKENGVWKFWQQATLQMKYI